MGSAAALASLAHRPEEMGPLKMQGKSNLWIVSRISFVIFLTIIQITFLFFFSFAIITYVSKGVNTLEKFDNGSGKMKNS